MNTADLREQIVKAVDDALGRPQEAADAVLAVLRPVLDRAEEAERALRRIRDLENALYRQSRKTDDVRTERDEARAEAERLRYALDDIMWGGAHLDVRASMQNALRAAEAERDEARAALDRVRALCDEPAAGTGNPYGDTGVVHVSDLRAALGEQP